MAVWSDLYKLFSYAFEDDPLSKKSKEKDLVGAGVALPGAIPDIRQDGSFWSGSKGLIRLRESNDFLDLSSVTSRTSRYKEYDRLINVAEINSALTVIADEACVAGGTKISTPYYGAKSIEWFVENKKDERFLTYCWDFEKNDYTLGWAFDPRYVKTAETLKIKLDNGSFFVVTPDHKVLKANGTWSMAEHLRLGDELMPFYRIPANPDLNDLKVNQYPRIFTFEDGWKHERRLIDEWRLGKKEEKYYKRAAKEIRLITSGLTCREVGKLTDREWPAVDFCIKKEGFTYRELRWLGNKKKARRIISIEPYKTIDVFDLSVEKHHCFCTDSVILHNCQKGENKHVFEIFVENEEIKKELEFLFFHRKMLNVDRNAWSWTKSLCIKGDLFLENIINSENPKDGILKTLELPAESLFRIETVKNRLIEFQQSKEGPDIAALTRTEVTKATQAEVDQSVAIRFTPDQITHFRLLENRKTFYPYGISLIEPARGPAHQLRMMEDAMLIYRLVRAPERKVFYIDVGTLPPFKAEAFVDRMKDLFRKKKVSTNRSSSAGAEGIDERWGAPAADEDYWVPIRPNSNTRIDTLPGAQNLGEIDDAIYFRDKLYRALNFPKNYFSSEDPNATRITLSAQDVKFARFIERIQSHMEDGFMQIAEKHLTLRGFPEELFDDLNIKMTPPSDWKELSRAEVVNGRISNATSLKGSMIMGDYDILTKWMKYSEGEAEDIIARNKIQQLDQVRLQIIASNPQLGGFGNPGSDETEMGAEAGGPNPMLGPEGEIPQEEPQDGSQEMPQTQQKSGIPLQTPSRDDIKKYDLIIQNYETEQDHEDIDFSSGE